MATRLVQSGKVRVNATAVSKPARGVQVGDVLTFPKDDHTRVIKIVDLGTRRGPAPEAQALYDDLDPPKPKPRGHDGPQAGHKPTARERRALSDFKRGLI